MEPQFMNLPAALIAAGLGGAFFAAELAFYIQPSWINSDYLMGVIFSSNQSKARVAVTRLLVDPTSAKFGELRTVEAEKAKFVCGAVKAKDRAGYYAEYREFVYTVATDSARIDDDGWIAQKHAAFKVCPVAPEEKPDQQKISPNAVSMVKAIEKAVPAAANSALSTTASNMPAGSGSSSGGSLEQQVGHMANQIPGGPLPAAAPGSASLPGSGARSGSAGQPQASSTFTAALGNESEWRGDRPPAAWPNFPFDHPLAKWAQKRTTGQAMALAKGIEDRWEQSRYGNAKGRPSADEIQEACRALLAIDPKDTEFPKAWAAFVRLRKIDREAGS
jgi:hypothetical protein